VYSGLKHTESNKTHLELEAGHKSTSRSTRQIGTFRAQYITKVY